MKKVFTVFDIDVIYNHRPDDDIYQALVPDSITVVVEVPDNFDSLLFEEQVNCLKTEVMEDLQELIKFDTDDEPDFEIGDVSFCFEEVIE